MKNLENFKVNDYDSFESAIEKLEEIVAMLNRGNLTLDETLALYEDGIHLYRYCNEKLDRAEQRITLIMNENEIPFHTNDMEDLGRK